MYCSNCGANNPDNATVCSQCGKNLLQQVVAPAVQQQVPNYLVFAILSTVLCCLPAGIVAIVYAAQVNGKLQAGDLAGAQLASKNAKMWTWISAGAGLAFGILWVMFVFLSAMRHH